MSAVLGQVESRNQNAKLREMLATDDEEGQIEMVLT